MCGSELSMSVSEGLGIGFTFSGKVLKSLIMFLDTAFLVFYFCQKQIPSGGLAQKAFR